RPEDATRRLLDVLTEEKEQRRETEERKHLRAEREERRAETEAREAIHERRCCARTATQRVARGERERRARHERLNNERGTQTRRAMDPIEDRLREPLLIRPRLSERARRQ